MNKISKPAFKFILGGFLLVSAAVISCNSEEKKEETPAAPATTEQAPATNVPDSTTHAMDSGAVKPVVPGN